MCLALIAKMRLNSRKKNESKRRRITSSAEEMRCGDRWTRREEWRTERENKKWTETRTSSSLWNNCANVYIVFVTAQSPAQIDWIMANRIVDKLKLSSCSFISFSLVRRLRCRTTNFLERRKSFSLSLCDAWIIHLRLASLAIQRSFDPSQSQFFFLWRSFFRININHLTMDVNVFAFYDTRIEMHFLLSRPFFSLFLAFMFISFRRWHFSICAVIYLKILWIMWHNANRPIDVGELHAEFLFFSFQKFIWYFFYLVSIELENVWHAIDWFFRHFLIAKLHRKKCRPTPNEVIELTKPQNQSFFFLFFVVHSPAFGSHLQMCEWPKWVSPNVQNTKN